MINAPPVELHVTDTHFGHSRSILDTCHNHDTYGEAVRGTIFDDVFGVPHKQEIEINGFYILILSGALHSSSIYGETPNTGPTSWGFDLHTPTGLSLLERKLTSKQGYQKLLFSHVGLVSPRQPPIPADPNLALPAIHAHGYCMQDAQATAVRKVLNRQKVVAHYCGHSHVNAHHPIGGTHFIATSSLVNFPAKSVTSASIPTVWSIA